MGQICSLAVIHVRYIPNAVMYSIISKDAPEFLEKTVRELN